MRSNSLVELDRAHLVHPVVSWRGHEATGVRVLTAANPSRQILDRAWKNGLIIRAFANGVIGFAPPLCCTSDEIDAIVERTRVTLDQTLADPDVRAVLV